MTKHSLVPGYFMLHRPATILWTRLRQLFSVPDSAIRLIQCFSSTLCLRRNLCRNHAVIAAPRPQPGTKWFSVPAAVFLGAGG